MTEHRLLVPTGNLSSYERFGRQSIGRRAFGLLNSIQEVIQGLHQGWAGGLLVRVKKSANLRDLL